MRKNKLLIGLVAITLSLVTLSSCAKEDRHSINGNVDESYWGDIEDHMSSDDPWDVSSPNVNITEIGSGQIGHGSFDTSGGDINTSIEQEITDETTIYDMVYRSVEFALDDAGFSTRLGGASEIKDHANMPKGIKRANEVTQSDASIGIIYYMDDYNLFDNGNYYSAGFYEIVEKNESSNDFKDDSTIYLQAINDDSLKDFLCAYSYDNIGYDHFVFQDKYITYHAKTDRVIEYEVMENTKANYNYDYGSLYDYDHKKFIYDETLFQGYIPQPGTSLIDQGDYTELQNEIKQLVKDQNANGYKVESVNIVYISPEAIQEYLDSEENDTFYGYDVEELTASIGEGRAIEYVDGEVRIAQKMESTGFNWKSFLTKIAIGAGIIIAGACLAPLTGGASFGCALVTITQAAVGFALTSAVTELVTSTVKGLGEGKSLVDSIVDSLGNAANKFADGFMVGAAVSSVGVVTGLIKPTACFTPGTLVATYNMGEIRNLPIEEVKVGDQVITYNEETKRNEVNTVTDTLLNKTSELVKLDLGEEVITTTTNHPFYDYEHQVYRKAGSLRTGDKVYTLEGKLVEVEEVSFEYFNDEITVYNLTVENNHNYFVGENEVLVHNKCTTLTNNKLDSNKQSLFEKAKKKVLEKITDGEGNPKYKLPKKVVEFVKNLGKLPTEKEGSALGGFIKDTLNPKEIVNAYKEGLASKEKQEALRNNPDAEVIVIDKNKESSNVYVKIAKSVIKIKKDFKGFLLDLVQDA